jgi:parvulin-like peptidyl-prolyl isomerase
VTPRPLWNLLTLSACALAGCAGTAGATGGDNPYAPGAPRQAASEQAPDVIGPGQRYPVRVSSPPPPKLTISDDSPPIDPPAGQPAAEAQQTAGSEPIDQPLFAPPPAPVVRREEWQRPLEEGELFEPSQVVARVGDQIILYGEVAPMVDQALQPYLASAKSKYDRDEILSQRDVLTEQIVRQFVETKLLYLEFLREIPRDQLEEAKKKIKANIGATFEASLTKARQEVAAAKKSELERVLRKDPVLMRLALLMNEKQLETVQELDAALRKEGTSLDRQMAFFMEYHLGQEMIRKQINFKPEVSHQEMLDHYSRHADQFVVAAKARFEILTLHYQNFPSRQAAEQALAEMGNAVYLGGASFASVAQKSSQEPGASKGGQHDWTTKGSLASEVIDEAIFSLPLGKLSQILHDDRGCHIVRVIERSEAGQVPFTDAQTKIKEAIMGEKRQAQYKKYVESLRGSTPVWTIYDDKNLARQPRGEERR